MNRRSLQYFYIYFLVILVVSISCFFLQRFHGVGYMSDLYNQYGHIYNAIFFWEKYTLFSVDDLNLGFLEKILALAIILFPLHMSVLNKNNKSLYASLILVIFLWLTLSVASGMNVFGYVSSGGGVVSFSSTELYTFTLLPILVLAWFLAYIYLKWYKSKQLS